MILIAISWFILLLFLIPSGIAMRSLFKIQSKSSFIPLFLGLFMQGVFLSICSFFFRIGIEVFIANGILILAISILKKTEIVPYWKQLLYDVCSLSPLSKVTIVLIFIFSLFKCAQSPFIIDNESYYIQTIKWINEYGFVKGLGNLHIYLGQTSPFHVLQAGFNFNFLTDRSNDLNGFILLISSLYFLFESEKKYKFNGKINWIGLIPVFNILFFQFINAPSPDLTIILVSQIFFYYFLEKEDSFDNFKVISLLFLFIVFIKITVAPFFLLVAFLIFKSKKRMVFFGFSSIIIATILLFKNTIITAYPLYPFNIFPLDVDWKVPQNLLEFAAQITEKAGYFKTTNLKNPSLIEKLNSWIHLGGINRVFNIGMLLLFVFGLFLVKIKKQTKFTFLYFTLLIHFLLLLFTSPQFRFFLPEFIFFSVYICSHLLNYLKIKLDTLKYLVLIAIVVPLFLVQYIDYSHFTANKLLQQKEKHSWQQIIIPERNSKYPDAKFEKIKEDNLIYNSPIDNFFFYGTANGDLPCVNKVQIEYLKKKLKIKPQLRTSNIADGFYSKKNNK